MNIANFKRMIALAGPYLALMVLPGGTLFAFLLWLSRRSHKVAV